MSDTCRGPKCSRPAYAKGLCNAHHRQSLRRNKGERLKPLMTNGEAALRLSLDEAAALLRMAKRQKMTLHELAKRIVSVGVGQK